jgi:hypothetical protein
MKKIVGLLLVVLVVIAGGVFWFQSKINDAINSKIAELNNSGFVVKHEQSTNYVKTSAKGEIEVIYPDKALPYILADMKNLELKKLLETQYNALDSNEKSSFFEGIKFEYDFVYENFNNKFTSNIYFTNLSKKVMYNLSADTNDESSKWLLDFLKNKKLQVSINEKKEYKIADIDTVIPNEVFITIRGWSGNEKNAAISLFKLSGTGESEKEFLILNNLNIDFDMTQNKESSKTSVNSIEFQDANNFLNIKNLVMSSTYEKTDKNINTQSEIGFDEVIAKAYNEESLNLKKSALKVNVSNLPIKTLEEVAQYYKDLKYDEYLKALTQNGTTIQSSGMASNYIIRNQKIFDTLKFDLALGLNKNGSILEAKKVNDILDNAKITIDLDAKTAENAKALLSFMPNAAEVNFIDTNDNLKRFESVLKNDGVYVNNKKVLEENQLLIPEKEEPQVFDDTPIQKVNQKNLTYTHKMIDENLLKLDIKYNTSLKVISSGGISVSFPQFKDSSRMIKHDTNTFKEINYYNAGTEIWNGGLQQNIISSYLLVEGWDENWKNKDDIKTISLIIDVNGLETLEVYLRAGALNETDSTEELSEIVPISGDIDQQNYPVEVIEIPLFRAR